MEEKNEAKLILFISITAERKKRKKSPKIYILGLDFSTLS